MNLTSQIKIENLKQIPIRKIDFNNPAAKQKHDEMVKLVETMLDLHKQIQKVKLPSEKDSLQQRIDHTDLMIKNHVYELCELTEEEIKIA